MPSRWLPGRPLMVISTACGRDDHDQCETQHCGCLCHMTGNAGPRHHGQE